MTPKELSDIDQKVAEVIGDTSTQHEWEQIGYDYYESSHICQRCGETYHGDSIDLDTPKECVRKFSTDWNAAMYAAEKCLEFVRDYVVFPRGWNKDGSGSVYWVVSKVNSQNELGDDFVSDPSGALAISWAILKLKGQA